MAAVGRPRKFEDPEAFAHEADAYFASLEGTTKPPTLAALCRHMGFTDQESFSNYASYGDDFSRTVKDVTLRILQDRQERLLDKAAFTPGVIFDLKNNHGWKDVQAVESSGPNGAPIQHTLSAESLTDEQLRALASIKV